MLKIRHSRLRYINICRKLRAGRSLPLSRAFHRTRIHARPSSWIQLFGAEVRPTCLDPRQLHVASGHEHDDHLQGSLARARNVVSRGGRRPSRFPVCAVKRCRARVADRHWQFVGYESRGSFWNLATNLAKSSGRFESFLIGAPRVKAPLPLVRG